MVYISKSLEETSGIAKLFLDFGSSESGATVVAFFGDLGAGKTTFIQALAKEMEIDEPTTSPTFVIQKSYKAKKYFDTLIHIDAYRLESGEELSKLRFEETLKLPNALICIEWPDNVKSILPENTKRIICKFIDETTHSYEF